MEHRFSRTQFLEEACRKAGLPRQAWNQDDVQVLGFTCEVFSEGRRRSKE
jgi:AMMECR1 domain-containing protein